ncbi:MAG: rhodanese-like domain-containing protein [Saprospiraceae bacterium]|nr:rhodanese-like domain-containing protein [Saprospiraceae bacterium]
MLLILFSGQLFASCKQPVTESANQVQAAEPAVVTAPDQGNPVLKNINVAEARKLMAENKDLVILDVRTPGEVSQGIIKGAVVIDIKDPAFLEKVNKLDKSKPTLVYCKVGGRSARAADAMSQQGFKTLYNLNGGYDAWKK